MGIEKSQKNFIKLMKNCGSIQDVIDILSFEKDLVCERQDKAKSLEAATKLQDHWIMLDAAVEFLRNYK